MLRIIETFNHLPSNFHVDPDSKFEPGQVGSLKIKNGETVVSVCDGINPIGIIDDIKTNYSREVKYNSNIIIPCSNFKFDGDNLILLKNINFELKEKNIISKSWYSDIPIVLDSKKGDITVVKGTVIKNENYSKLSNSVYITFHANYAFNFKLKTIEDSTLNSKRITVWNKLLIGDTNMFDTTVIYNKYSNLYSNNGLFTTARPTHESKTIGVVLSTPMLDNTLRFLFDLDNKIEIGSQ